MVDDRYVAGLFDGEGWFQIDRSKRSDVRRGVTFQLHARITMRDRVLLRTLQKAYGGSFRKSSDATEKRAAYWSWDLCGHAVLDFVQKVGSHLVVKKKQAELAAQFQLLKQENKNQPCSDARFAQLEAFYHRMRVLNRKGVSR